MCIHGDKAQQERDWVLSGKNLEFCFDSLLLLMIEHNHLQCQSQVCTWLQKAVNPL
jgi:hypothetical protein